MGVRLRAHGAWEHEAFGICRYSRWTGRNGRGAGDGPIISGILNQVNIQVGAVVHFCADME